MLLFSCSAELKCPCPHSLWEYTGNVYEKLDFPEQSGLQLLVGSTRRVQVALICAKVILC